MIMNFDYKLPQREHSDNFFDTEEYKRRNFLTNLYPIRLTSQSKIYQYKVLLPSEFEADCREIYNEAIRSSIPKLKETVGYLAHSGQFVWGTKKQEIVTELESVRFEVKKSKMEMKVSVMLTK